VVFLHQPNGYGQATVTILRLEKLLDDEPGRVQVGTRPRTGLLHPAVEPLCLNVQRPDRASDADSHHPAHDGKVAGTVKVKAAEKSEVRVSPTREGHSCSSN